MKRLFVGSLLLLLLSIAGPAGAGDEGRVGVDTSKWGIRVGLATDPDQLVAGANFLETEIARRVFLEPNAEIGVGDDHTIVSASAPFHYRFKVDAKVQPYAGGGVTLGLDDDDKGDTNFEIALRATGGVIFRLKGGREMFGELNLVFGDLHDIQAMVGWRF